MIYTDGQHTVADTEQELHEFFDKIMGFEREWYHDKVKDGPRKGQPLKHPHYDVLSPSKKRLLKEHSEKNGGLVRFLSIKEIAIKSHQMIKK